MTKQNLVSMFTFATGSNDQADIFKAVTPFLEYLTVVKYTLSMFRAVSSFFGKGPFVP